MPQLSKESEVSLTKISPGGSILSLRWLTWDGLIIQRCAHMELKNGGCRSGFELWKVLYSEGNMILILQDKNASNN